MDENGRPGRVRHDDCARLLLEAERRLADAPVELLEISTLMDGDSPRLAGEDFRHVRLLAEMETALPPVVVSREDRRVIDGMHRVRAARLRGEAQIRAQFFEGGAEEAYLFSISANLRHGLPLSLADRVAAAERVLLAHADWSDRAIASLTGISARKVTEIRRKRFAQSEEPGERRLGRDGRARPVNGAAGRERARILLRENPSASLRQIARAAGIAPTTVADVRDRMRREPAAGPGRQHPATVRLDPYDVATERLGRGPARSDLPHLLSLFERLKRDPALRFNESGRMVLRMLDAVTMAVREKDRIVTAVPAHCADPMASLLRACSGICASFADELEDLRNAAAALDAPGGG